MKQYEKEILQAQLDNEKKVLKQLEDMYADALAEINDKIAMLLGRQDSDMQHVVYQVEFQKSLKKQVEAILETMHSNEFETISEYLANCYNEGYLGAMYSLQKQGIPLVFPISQEQVLAAIQTESNLSTTLYEALGHNIKDLQKKIAGEISRGIAGGQMYTEIARNIAGYARIPKNNAMRIVRTEANRIQNKASMDACNKAQSKGADVVKQWDASLDKRTRRSHRHVDGEIRELDEPFSNGLQYPSDPSGKASEVINCRCALLQRARWALGNDYTKWSPDAPVVIDDDGTTQFSIIEAKNYKEFQKKYNQATERVRSSVQKMNDKGTSQEKTIEKDDKYFDAISELKEKGAIVDISGAGTYVAEAKESVIHLKDLMNEYHSTVVSYTIQNKQLAGVITEAGSAYMMNGKTSISVIPKALKRVKATDALGLGEKQPLGITYHEFAHALSQSRGKIDKGFWKEIRAIKKDYENQRNTSDWFNIKISDYASKDVDEFLAEAFTQAKLSENPSPYSKEVLAVIDKYFKKKE